MGEVTVCAQSVVIGVPGRCIGVPPSGEYTLGNLDADEYRVSFQPAFDSNYVRQYYSEDHPGTIYFADATVLSLDASDDLTGIDAAIEEGATISGTVVGEGDTGPIEGIQVCAEEIGGAWYQTCGQTQADGTYQVVGVR